jgi:histone H2A
MAATKQNVAKPAPTPKTPEKAETKKTETKKKVAKSSQETNFMLYIGKLLNRITNDVSMQNKSRYELQSLVRYVIDLYSNASKLLLSKQTLTADEITAASNLVLPAELAHEVVSFVNLTLEKYNNNKDSKGTREDRADLTFRIPRCTKSLRNAGFKRVGEAASIALAAALECVFRRVLEAAAHCAQDSKKARISPRHLMVAIRSDASLNTLFNSVVLSGGVMPNIHEALLK